jgi:two-component system, NarL family, nitrate/nitrite response regulator NarL
MSQSPTPRSKVRVVIVEDHVLFAESLELALGMEGYQVRRMPVPEPGGSMSAYLSSIVRQRPMIVLLDLDLGNFGDGVRLIAPLAQAGTSVVVVTASTDRDRWGECVRYGARKVLSKTRPLNEILATVRRINQGLPVMDAAEREELLQLWHERRVQLRELSARLDLLTAREREVLGHLTLGHTVRDIAAIGFVSEATVRTQVKSILAKLEVSSQIAAVGLAHHAGWRSPVS